MLGMRIGRLLKSLFVVGACTLTVTMLPGSGAAQPSAGANVPAGRPAVGEPPAKPLASSNGVVKSAGSVQAAGVAGGFVFVPINPYRTLDSRAYPNGFVLAGETWHFDVLTNVDGASMIPDAAVAVTYNLTVAGTVGGGYCALYPADINWPGNSSINWTASNQTIANGGTVAIGYLDAPGQVEIYCGSLGGFAGTDFILDITGFYI